MCNVASRIDLAACLSRILYMRLRGSGLSKLRCLKGAAAPLGLIDRGSIRIADASAALGLEMRLSRPML